MHFHGLGFFFAPFLLGFGLLKALLFVALIVLFVRLVAGHGHGHNAAWAHHGYATPSGDPRRVAAMRYASGRIGRDEFEQIMRDLDATAGQQTPPTA